MIGRRQRFVTRLCLLLGVLLYPSVRVAAYDECTLNVGTHDEANLKVELTCVDGDDNVVLQSPDDPVPINEEKDFPGTPITLFSSKGVVVEIFNNTDPFKLTNSEFGVLPNALADAEAPLTLRDARVTLEGCTFKENSHATSGGIHLLGGNDAPDTTADGPHVEILKTTFEGGNGKAGGLFIEKFPNVVVRGASFLPNKEALSSFIEHKGFGTVKIYDSEFEGPKDVTSVRKATALYGSGSGTVHVENCKFTKMVGSAVDWESSKGDKAELIFKGCTFSDCYSSRDGGVFLVKSPLTLAVEDSKFTGNSAVGQGGVFHVEVKDPADRLQLDMSGTEFTENSAESGGSVIYLGTVGQDTLGYTAEISLNDCKIHGNKKTTPIHMKGGGFVNLTIAGGSFENNVDRFLGGALGLEQMAKVEISGALFKGNQVIGETERTKIPSGGAINCKEIEELSIVDSRFENNKLVTTEKETGGGAIFLSNDEPPMRPVENRILNIQNTKFENNAAGWKGGSIHAIKVDHIYLIDSSFDQNDAGVEESGGVISAFNTKVFSVQGSTFKNAKSAVNGGALSLKECKQVTVVGSTIEGNSVEPDSSEEEDFLANAVPTGSGGGIAMECAAESECSLAIEDSEFTDNRAVSEGGALLVSSVVGCNITRTQFTQKEKVTGNGGAAKIDTKALKLVGGGFSGGQSDMGGALFLESAESIEITGTKFSSNVAEKSGSAVYYVAAPSGGDVKIADATFTRNKADMNDGGCVFLGDLEAFSVNDSEFSGNQGGGVVLKSITGGVEIGTTKFMEGKSDGDGAAVNVDDTPKVTIDGSIFHANSAVDGGAVQLANVTALTMMGSTFSRNKGKRYGGGAHLIAIEEATIKDVTFSENEVDSKEEIRAGGGLAMKAVESTTLTNIIATGNKGSAVGGGISAYEGDSIVVEGCTFTGNSGSAAGGLSVQEFATGAKISQTDFKSNSAGAGGAIYFGNTPAIEATSCKFDGNKADHDGGAIRVNNGTTALTVKTSGFSRNTARLGSGGGISVGSRLKGGDPVASVETLSCEKCTFTANLAKNGGGINVYGATVVDIASSRFEKCYVEGNGGSVNFYATPTPAALMNMERNAGEKEITVAGSDFVGSSTKNGFGGSMAVTGAGNIVLSIANITGSTANQGGAAYFENSGAVAITDTEITNTKAIDGGAIVASNLDGLSITGGVFKQNTANENGGTLLVTGTDTKIDSSVISNAKAGEKGGAVYLTDSSLAISDSVVEKSEAEFGGALALSGSSDVQLQSVNFTDNTATSWEGSVVFSDSCDSKVKAEGTCSVQIPFKRGFGGMAKEEDAVDLAFDVQPECNEGNSSSINMEACIYDYLTINGVGGFMILAYILLGLACIGLVVMFTLVAFMKTSLIPAKAPSPTTLEPLMDEGNSMA
ncbi:hypothetical protein BSKO_11867 [Bryopsis sp. KO-2023]|nr:hypothetical protein BSKO_11867 [Bryopsis sp. KO-2023]